MGRSTLRYERLPPIVWTELGGIVWVGLAVWLLALLGFYGYAVGVLPARYVGLAYTLADPPLSPSDVDHMRLGGAVRDSDGRLLVDPATDHVLFLRIDRGGGVEAWSRSRPAARPSLRTIAIVEPGTGVSYADVVAVLDGLRAGRIVMDAVWIVPRSADPRGETSRR